MSVALAEMLAPLRARAAALAVFQEALNAMWTPAEQKRAILDAHANGFISHQDTELLIQVLPAGDGVIVSDQIDAHTEQFRQFIIAACATDPGPIKADGRWHRFRISNTRHKSSKPGRYMMHADGRPNGIFMDWRDSGVRHIWKAGDGVESIDRDEIDRRRRARLAEQQEGFRRAAERAQAFWTNCTKINGASHPYLDAKGIGPHGARYGSGELFGLGKVQCVIVPISGPEGKAMSLQAIRADGERRFWPGSTHEGGHYQLGKDDGVSPVIFCEGFSTAASLREATGNLVVMCVTSGNMGPVATWAGHRWHGRELIVAGDDDWHLVDNPKVRKNVGREAAERMARNLGGRLVMPDMAGLITDGGDDFNDMARELGRDEVAALFRPAALPARETALPLVWARDAAPVLAGNWIVKRVIPADGFVSVIGEPGCGKSFFILDLACHIAAGLIWRGRKVARGLVVYLAAEGQRGQLNRLSAWKNEHGVADMPLALIPVGINLRDAATDLPKLIQTIEVAVAEAGLPLSMLVVDTLNRSFGGGDENGEDMGQYVANADKLRAHFGCTTVHVHHIPKSGDLTERGHGSLRGAIDTSLGIVNDPQTGIRTLICLKQKDGEDGWNLSFKLKRIVLGQDEDGDDVTTCVTEADDEAVGAVQRERGPNLSATQRLAYNELLATLEASAAAIPRDIPDDQIDRNRVGKVALRSVWRDRWLAIAGADMAHETASATFRRAVTDLINKGLVGAWNDHVWATHR